MQQPITVTGLSVAYRTGPALTDLSLSVAPGERVALVGENGSGKSTLLRAIARRLPGTARVAGATTQPEDLVWLPQEPPFRDTDTVAGVLRTMLAPLRRAVADVEAMAECLDDPTIAEAYAERLDWAVAHDAWGADRRARTAAARLGITDLADDRTMASLSGGQRTRLALAAALARRPDALLLDEPTNHLDDDAVSVLVQELVQMPGAVLFASHDRAFLDEAATALVDLDPSEFGTDGLGGSRFGGGWSAYEEHRAASRARWERAWTEQQDEIRRLRAATRIGTDAIAHNRGPTDNDKFIHAFKGANVERTLARRKRDATRRLEEAEADQVRKPRPPLRFTAPIGAPAGTGRVVVVRDLVVHDRLRTPVVDLGGGQHLLVTGPNGAGKSTLLGVLSGRLTATSGTVQVTARRVIELVQDPVFDDLRSTPQQIWGDPDDDSLRQLGLLHPQDVNRSVGALSVGQRRRLGLALAIREAPDLLLLDEPTNHLSLTLAGELEDALDRSPASVVVASHDRWLRRRWSGPEIGLTSLTHGA